MLSGNRDKVMPSHALFHKALALFQTGQLEAAASVCDEIIRLEQTHFDTRFLRSVIAMKVGDPARAVEMLASSIEGEPNVSKVCAACCHLGSALRALGRLTEAVASYDKAIAIDARYALAYLGRGNALRQLGQPAAALASYDLAIASQPNNSAALCNRGVVLAELGRLDEALSSFTLAIAIRPDYAEACWNRGIVLQRQNKPEAALQSYDQAVAIAPTSAKAHYNRANVLLELARPESALAGFDHAIAIDSRYALAFCGRATALSELDRFDEAFADYARAIAIKPDIAEVYSNRGNAKLRMGCVEEALRDYEHALDIDPTFHQAVANRAHALLLSGNLAEGWKDFEARFLSDDAWVTRSLRGFRQPRWQGGVPVEGKTLLLHCEQGLGDTLQFCRYANLVSGLGARVVMEVPAPLTDLLASLAGVAQLVEQGDTLPDFDYHCPLMSLPLVFNTTVSTIPAEVPYLRAPPSKVLEWKGRLGERNNLRVGIVWSGGFRADQPKTWHVNRRRNIALAKLATLKIPNVDFYSLQKGQPAESELCDLRAADWNGPGLIDFTHLLYDLSDTAALIANLDLVVSVDTSTAHLAGALGKPVWIMNRFDTCWRWLLNRTDSPWYPTAKLYRQPRPGDWESVVLAIRDDLAALAAP
jgi:tetratricopeptide (TPR) repeat protein